MTPYSKSTEQAIEKFFKSLSEKDRRRYAAIESKKLGHGGISYIANLLGCSRETIRQGLKEIDSLPENKFCSARVRSVGGGRDTYEEKHDGIDAAFFDVLKDHIAGDPMNENALWTIKTRAEICQALKERHNISVSETVVKQLLQKHKLGQRKIQKRVTMKETENRNEQFEKISKLRESYLMSDNPIISIDTKKKKILATSIEMALSIQPQK